MEKAAERRLNKYFHAAKARSNSGVDFVNFVILDPPSLCIDVFSDSSFACNIDLSSQLGFVVTLVAGRSNENIVYLVEFKV